MAWTGYNEETNHHIPTKELDFKAELGLRKGLGKLKNPIDFFTLFFNDKFRDDICTYTHMYHLDMLDRRFCQICALKGLRKKLRIGVLNMVT